MLMALYRSAEIGQTVRLPAPEPKPTSRRWRAAERAAEAQLLPVIATRMAKSVASMEIRYPYLRKTYGRSFARGCGDDEKLGDVLRKLDEPSLAHLIRDHEGGRLKKVCQEQR